MFHVREFTSRNPRRPHRVLRRRVVTGLVIVLATDLVGAALAGAFASFFLHLGAERADDAA